MFNVSLKEVLSLIISLLLLLLLLLLLSSSSIKIIFSEVLDKQCMPNKVYSSHILHAFEVLLFLDFDCIRILFWKNVVSVLPSVLPKYFLDHSIIYIYLPSGFVAMEA